MAVTERRTITRTTTRSSGAQELKKNISNIAEELSRVRDRAREEVTALDKIRGMLDVGYLSDLLRSVEELEHRIEEIESDALSANEAVGRLNDELEQERARLEKLWKAYKSQEDELERLKRDYPLMEEKLFERERTIDALRKDIARLEGLSKYKADYETVLSDNKNLQAELSEMERQLQRALEELKALEDEAASLRELAPHRARAEELEQLLEEERERLAKLYKVYEDLEREKKDVEGLVADWEAWFKANSPAMERICAAVADAPHAH